MPPMLLRDRLEAVGSRLFRFRSFIPVLAVAEIPIAVMRAEPDRFGADAIAPIGLVLALCGLAFRILTIGFVPGGTSGRNFRQKARRLNTTGAYSIVRNPLYVANFFCWTGVSLMLRDPLLIALNAALFLIFYLLIILREERFLEGKFGDDYRAFAERVPCLIPDPRLWYAPNRDFSLRTALRREPDTIFGTIASLVGLQLVWQGFVPGTAPVGTFWIALLGGTLVLWLALKWMKRFTGLLRGPAQPAPQSPVR